MSMRFTNLASGSGGNSSLIECDDVGLLLDIGLGPRVLASRLADAGSSWDRIRAVVLTHTHSDHWDEGTLTQLWKRRVALHCAKSHRASLRSWSRAFNLLEASQLVHEFEPGGEMVLCAGLHCLPIPVRHDSGDTFGFRFRAEVDLFGEACSLAYAADLGCWDASLARSLADVDLLALEFNHDIGMQVVSGRSPTLIARVLGDEGHLSNDQAANLLREILHASPSGRPAHVVLLHLSRECNRPSLAEEAARSALGELGREAEIHVARQDEVGHPIVLGVGSEPRRRTPRGKRGTRKRRAEPAWLPGLEPLS